jgi:hypothetical protein
MIFTQHFTDDTDALLESGIMGQSHLGHGVEYAPVHRFQAVPYIRESTGDNDTHGIVEVGTPHFLFDIYGFNSFSYHFLLRLRNLNTQDESELRLF